VNSASGVTTITLTVSGSISDPTIAVYELTDTAPPVFESAAVVNNVAASTTPSGAAITPAGAAVLLTIIGVPASITGIHAGNAFSNAQSTPSGDVCNFGTAEDIVASTGTFTPQWDIGSSRGTSSTTVSFKAPSAPPPGGFRSRIAGGLVISG